LAVFSEGLAFLKKNIWQTWRCYDYIKCKSRVSTAEDNSLM